MRYLFGLLCVCALGVMPLVGCDDDNECTFEYCGCDDIYCTPECVSTPVLNGTDCTFDGVAGVCVSGECGENLCEGVVCEDNDACTDDTCDYVVGSCIHHNIYGMPCEVDGLLGICSNVGSCEVGGDPCTADELLTTRCNPVEEVWLQECRELGTAKEPAYQWVNFDKCDPVCQQDSEGAYC